MNTKSRLTSFSMGLVGVTLLVLGGACGNKAPNSAPAAPPPPAVTVARVEQRELVEWSEFTGRTEPVQLVEVRPRVSGYIQEVRFQAGQLVKKGDLLFVIDPRWHKADFDQRKAEVDRAAVLLENAKREADRTKQLLADKAISTEDADARVARFQEAKAALLAAEATRDSAKLDLEYTEVHAPIDGQVSRALWTEGNYINGVAGAATLLTTIASVDPVYVHSQIDESMFLRFNSLVREKKIQTNPDGSVPVDLELADESGYPRHGKIESFDNRLEPSTGTILLRAVFPNEDGRILPGMFARIRVPASERQQALFVAETAVGTDLAQKFVLTVTSSNTVAYQPVVLGPAIEGKRLVRSGLQANDKIIVNGLQRVRPGMPVTVKEEVAQTASLKVAGQ